MKYNLTRKMLTKVMQFQKENKETSAAEANDSEKLKSGYICQINPCLRTVFESPDQRHLSRNRSLKNAREMWYFFAVSIVLGS